MRAAPVLAQHPGLDRASRGTDRASEPEASDGASPERRPPMPYVDGFVIPVPAKNLAAYVKMSKKAGKVWVEHGALEYRECVGDDLQTKMGLPFPRGIKAKRGEAVVFSWIVYSSRAHRDRVNKKIMKDPRIANMMADEEMPFDPRRMMYGGFKVLVDL